MGLFGDGGSRDDYLRLEARVRELEAQMAQLLAGGAAVAPGAPPPEAVPGASAGYPWLPEVLALLQRDRTIEAIKLTRERTGWGLKEAKDFVEGL